MTATFALVERNAEWIDRLYRRHARALTVYFTRRTWDAESAVDLVGETFAAAFADRCQFRGSTPEDAKAWLFGIAHHQLSNYRRRGAIERRAMSRMHVEPRSLSDEEIERIEEVAGLGALGEQVVGYLEELTPEFQEAVRLRVVEERTYAEMAAMLGITQVTARARVSRGLRALSDAVRDHPHLVDALS